MTTSFADLPPSVWAEATDDELDIIIAGLEAETTALDRDWILTPRQQAAEDLCTNLDPGKGHEILYGGAAGGGKLVKTDTPVATPSGWTTMGDLHDGDVIFGADGRPTTVVRAHAIDLAPVSFRLTFDDGTTIDACADHLWRTFDTGELAALTRKDPEWRARRRASRAKRGTGKRPDLAARNTTTSTASSSPPAGSIRTTKEIAATLLTSSGRTNHAIPLAGALELPHLELPLEPYALGLWLGDGSARAGQITTMDPELLEAFTAAGFELGAVSSKPNNQASRYGIKKMLPVLRELEVFGNKHVPPAYLRSSATQRLELLRGLMDTDGTVCSSGAVEFTNTNRRLADAVLELVLSLGWKARMVEGRAMLYGRDCGPKYDIKWTPDAYVFHLERKRARQKLATRRTTKFRYIVGCEEIEPTPMRCITVSADDGMFLVGREMVPTHNSQWMLWHLYHLALRYPGFSGLLIRRTFAQLTRTHIQMSFRRFDRSLCKFNQVSKTWRFANGSTIEFGYLDKASDVYNYDSAEYDTVCFDELTEWATPDNYLYLFSRIRTEMHLVEQGLVGHMVAATNPGRAGGAWVKARFIDFAEPMQRVDVADVESDAVTTRVFVPAKIDDNPHFGRRQYRANLMNVDAKRRKQLEDGDWDAIEGQYFDEWDRALHVREPFEIPQWWTKIRGLDWGITNPMCCLWAAFDGDGVCYIYRELYGTGMLNTIQARRVNEMTRPDEGVLYTMADPSIWTNTGNGMNTAEQYARAGLRCRKANNARVDGWARVREFLKVDEASGMPRLVIFNHCRNLIRTLPMLVHDSKNPEDLDTTGEDHAADAMRYLLMSRPKVTRSPKREAATLEAEHAEAVRQRRHDRSSRSVMHPELGRW